MKYIIFDTDMGTDDAWALIMLSKASTLKDFKIIGITCVHGNTDLDNCARNTLRVLHAVNRTDIPVYKGARNPMLTERYAKELFHGENGFGDVEYETNPDLSLIKSEHGVHAMYRMAQEHKNVTIICLGPLTNVALAVKMYPDFVQYVDEIHIMGGNYKGRGNVTQCAEFNFYQDPESVSIVLNTFKCRKVIVPWETALKDHIDISLQWRFEVLGAIDNPITRLMNPAEKAVYRPDVIENWIPIDATVIAALINPNEFIKKSSSCYATIELNGSLTRGQMIIDYKRQKPDNVTVIEAIDENVFKQLCLWAAGHPSDVSFE